MARTNFTPIEEALKALVNTMTETHVTLLAQANAERKEALSLYQRMRDTHADLTSFACIVGEAADQMAGIEDVSTEIAMKVWDGIVGGPVALPDCDYEDFAGICTECGKTIVYGDDCINENGELICADCFEDEEDENTAVEE